ncbi:hypothetical protein FB451DRAFT_1172013 [Mycena latifolia]|nr:hypothetical protein FB451DRAFT_1172013 [Mycena latifolia]
MTDGRVMSPCRVTPPKRRIENNLATFCSSTPPRSIVSSLTVASCQCELAQRASSSASNRMTLLKRIKFFQEITDNHGIVSDVTPVLYQEFLNSSWRLQEITTVYQTASLDFGACFGKFLRHVNVCVDDMGAENFLRRFSKVNDDEPDVIAVLNHLLAQAKIIGENDKAMETKVAVFALDPVQVPSCQQTNLHFLVTSAVSTTTLATLFPGESLASLAKCGCMASTPSHTSSSGTSSALGPTLTPMASLTVATPATSHNSLISGAPFGHKILDYSLLYQHVPAVFNAYSRAFTENNSGLYELQLSLMNNLEELLELEQKWTTQDYSAHALLLISKCILQVAASNKCIV